MVDAERTMLAGVGHTVVPVDAENSPSAVAAAAQLATAPWNLLSALRLRDAINQSQPDIAHVHNTWFAASPAVFRTFAKAGVPAVMTLHNYRVTCVAATLSRSGAVCQLCVGNIGWSGIRYRCYRGSAIASIAGTFTNVVARAAAFDHVSRFVVLTRFARDLFARSGLPADRITVVPNFTADPGPRPAPCSQSDTILFVGRLAPEKGIDILLEAWTRAKSHLRLQVIGDGPLADELRHRYSGVEFLGPLPPAEVTERMLGARALVFPSQWYEGQSLVVLEAMAARLPVLASDWPPIRDTLTGQEEQWFRRADNVAGWVDGITKVIEDDSTVDDTGRAVRAQYESAHTPDAAIMRLLAVYRSVSRAQ